MTTNVQFQDYNPESCRKERCFDARPARFLEDGYRVGSSGTELVLLTVVVRGDEYMWPWGHLGLGYLLAVPLLARFGLEDDYVALAALAVGTQLPDLVDKPLAWTFDVMPYGRAAMHSLLVLGVASVLVSAVLRSVRVGVPLLAGWATHLVGDVVYPLADGAVGDVTFLAWPLLALPEPAGDHGILAYFRTLSLTGETALEVGLFALAAGVFLVREWRTRRPSAGIVERAD